MRNNYYNQRICQEIPDDEVDNFGREIVSPACEIDESLMTHLGEGTIYERQCWCLGMFDRATKFVIPVVVGNDRIQDNLTPIIIENFFTDQLEPQEFQTRIYTDLWGGYNDIDQYGYQHFPINHTTGWGWGNWTTNHIENYWCVLKSYAKFNEGINCQTIEQVQAEVDRANWFLTCHRRGYDKARYLADILAEYKELNPDFYIINQ